jgi:hypothetical protein
MLSPMDERKAQPGRAQKGRPPKRQCQRMPQQKKTLLLSALHCDLFARGQEAVHLARGCAHATVRQKSCCGE